MSGTRNKKVSRIRELLLATGSAICLLFGVLSVPASAASVSGTVEMWTWNNEGDYVKVDQSAITRFKAANPGADVKITYIPYSDYVTKLKAALAAGNPPDIAQIPWAGEFRDIVESGKLTAMDSVLGSGFPTFFGPAQAAVTLKGKKYALPLDLNTLQIAYNKDIFKKLKLKVPTSSLTLIALAKALKKNKYEAISAGLKDQWVGGDLWFAQLAYTDKTSSILAKADAGDVPWTSSAIVAAGNEVSKLVKGGVFAPGANSMNAFTEALDLFVGQKAAMFYPVGNFISGGINDKVGKSFTWGLFPFPGISTDTPRATGGIARMFTLPKDGKNQAAAVELLKMFTNTEGAAALMSYAFIPAWKVDVPSDASPLFKNFLNAQSTARSRVIYTSPIYTALLNQMQAVLDGKATGQDVAKALAKAKP